MVDLVKAKSRGTLSNPDNRFSRQTSHPDEGVSIIARSGNRSARHSMPLDEIASVRTLNTEYIEQQCRSIVSSNNSPDLPFNQSINPYQGCEHGCIYCYARPTHEYLDLSLGLDFETKIHFKSNAVIQLEKFLSRPGYRCEPINIGANTDPYQQVERQQGITRSLLELLLECRHPVTIITKGSLILRDIDLLKAMAKLNLVKVMISVTSLSAELKSSLEPRAAAPQTRLRVIETLALAGVPVGVLMAPIIPAINDMEIEKIIEHCATAGAGTMHYVLLRLPFQLETLFNDWLDEYYPDRKHKVLHLLEQCHNGQIYQSEFGVRQTGTGIYARMINQRFSLACQKFGINHKREARLRTDLFTPPRNSQQIDLFAN
ncbi:radical SAM protein [Hahella sp. CCB-MM4]|uniref:PA0069 family radical SAM protein n=1 Tax=Hahella sp. (strain CCB-MM4) TaxID=1926491 RepID=UPI000B9B351E|nr:PA0069 family radical SAM protein [Hahella sp. CCB-MM4]OZG71544.1 radical SAM protein [Hahella sp. CCB-MM4]